MAAGISSTWYTYLEQGRAREVSPSVLDSLARVLQLSEDERRHMHVLMYGHVVDPKPLGQDVLPITEALKQVASIAERHPFPVYLLDHACDLLSWNRAATEWYGDWSKLPSERRNLILWMMTEPEARRSLIEWESTARDAVARWRADVARHGSSREINGRVEVIRSESREFAEWWDAAYVLEHRIGTRLLRHPVLGVRAWHVVPMGSFYDRAPNVIYHIPAKSGNQPIEESLLCEFAF